MYEYSGSWKKSSEATVKQIGEKLNKQLISFMIRQGSGEAKNDIALVQYYIYGTVLFHSRTVGYVIKVNSSSLLLDYEYRRFL